MATSNNPILSDTVPTLDLPPKTAEDFFNSPVYRRRTRSWGDQKYTPQMVPGYTGYIPKGLHHFGCRYAEICHYAISSFETDQQKNDDKNKELQTLRGFQSDPGSRESFTLAQNSTPLRPINPKAKPYLPAYAKQHSISPFYMPDDHPQKYHMSGYTGFVPKARKYLGQSYPTITRYALQEQAAEGKRLQRTANDPVKVFRPVEKVRTTVGIYPKDTGLVPHFTGHIPGMLCSCTSHCTDLLPNGSEKPTYIIHVHVEILYRCTRFIVCRHVSYTIVVIVDTMCSLVSVHIHVLLYFYRSEVQVRDDVWFEHS